MIKGAGFAYVWKETPSWRDDHDTDDDKLQEVQNKLEETRMRS